MDIALILGFALFGLSLPAFLGSADTSGAVPAGVAFLPGLMLNGRYQTESLVPVESFWLVGLAPLALLPFLLPRTYLQNPWVISILRLVAVLAPVVVAVVLASQHEQLAFEEEW
jgi:hypothetical protein